MAQAPTPGAGRHSAAADAAQKVMTITIRGESKRLAIGNVAIQEKLIVRKATGLPFEAFLSEDRIGSDSLMVMWWLARRGEGETQLTFDAACADWPADIETDDIEVTVDDPNGDDVDPEV